MFVIVTTAVGIYTFTTKPIYESTAMVLIDSKGKDGKVPFLDLTGTAATSKITNELETLKSYSMADAVARALINLQYIDAANKERIPILDIAPDYANPKRPVTPQQVVARLRNAVEFAPVRESDIIKVIARSIDPREAALLANTYTESYAERNVNSSRLHSRAVREFLQNQVQAKHGTLDSTEHQLQRYMKSSGMVNLDSDAKKIVDQLSQLEATRDALDIEISSRSRTLTSYRQELTEQEPNAARAIGESNDAYIRLLQEQLARLEVQRDVVIAQNPDLRGDSIYSQKLKEIDAQIASLKRNLSERTQSYLGSVLPGEVGVGGRENTAGFLGVLKQKIIEQQIELDGLIARRTAMKLVIADYEKQFNQIPEKSIELAKLQRARLSGEKLYLLVEEKYNEAAITETSEFGYVNIMDPAIIPNQPVSPKVALNLLLGVLLGLGFGVGIVILRSALDDRVRTPEDLKRYGFIPLSTIGRIEVHNGKRKNARDVTEDGKSFDAHLVPCFAPFSPLAESYRHLRTNVLYARPDDPVKTIVITSAIPKEGKSTTAANLAVTFAQDEKRVLLVDADMRRPSIYWFFGLEERPGLTDIVFGKETIDSVAHTNVLPNLDVICCGRIPPNPAEILGSKKMKEFIAHVRKDYDVVIFDSPPLLAVTDAAIMSAAADAVLLVVSSGTTRHGEIERASEVLAGVRAQFLGVVLNNLDVRHAYGRHYYAIGYGYYGPAGSRTRARSV